MMALGLMGMLALVGGVAAMRLSAWPMPSQMKISKLRATVNRVNRQNALLLLLVFICPLLMAALAHAVLGWKFQSSDLVFLAIPFLILAARGIGTLEWRVMFYAALVGLLGMNLFFTFASMGLCRLTDGIAKAAVVLEGQVDQEIGEAVVHERPLTVFPVMFYSRGRLIPKSFTARGEVTRAWGGGYLAKTACLPGPESLEGLQWIWWVGFDPEAGDTFKGAVEPEDEATHSWRLPPEWREKEVERYGNVTITLYSRKSVGD
jgi:hypothetical protein